MRSTMKILSRAALFLAVALFVGCAGAPQPVEEAKPVEEKPVEKVKPITLVEPEKKAPRVIVPEPPTTATHWAGALMAYEEGDYSEALKLVEKVRAAKPLRIDARDMEAKLRFIAKDPKGLPLLNDMVLSGRGGAKALHTFTRWSMEEGQSDEARLTLESLVGDGEEADPEAVAALAWLSLTEGDAEEALDLFDLIENTPQAARFSSFEARARFEAGDYEGVHDLYRKHPEEVGVKLAMGDVNRLEGRAAAAQQGYEAVLEADADNYQAKVNLGILKLGQGDAKAAKKLFEAAAKAAPDAAEAWCNLGLAQRELGEHDEALKSYERALEVSADHLPALKNMGILREKYFDDPAKALTYYNRYMELAGDDEEVTRWVKAASRKVGSAR